MKDIKKNIKNIEIESTDCKDSTFLYTFPVKIERIIESIRKVGLLNPVVLLKNKNKYKIISGLKRVLACKSLGFNTIDAFVCASGSISEINAFAIALYDNIAIRELNIVEKSIILNKLKTYFNLKDDGIIKDYMSVLQLEQSEKLLYDFLAIHKFSDDLKEHLTNRDIPIKVSSMFASISEEKLPFLSEIVTKLNLGANKIKELIILVDEITERDNINTAKLRSDLNIDEILKNERLTTSQKWEKIISLLREKRFPMWTNIEKKLLRNISSFNLPKNIRFRYPPYLEGDKFGIELEFSESDELKNIGQKLVNISEKKELSEIIKLI